MGVTDDLPDPAVRLRKADHGQCVVLVALWNIHSHAFVEPIVAADEVRHASEGLEDHVAVLPDEKLMELLGRVAGGAVVVVLGWGFRAAKR